MQKTKKLYQKDFGMVKIVPPKSWKPRKTSYEEVLSNLLIKNPIEQNPQGKTGVYEFKHIAMPSLLFPDFIKQYQNRQQVLKGLSSEQVETQFWKTLPYLSPVYGADIPCSLMDESAGSWHLNKLDTLLQKGLSESIKGVNTSYCYIGTWKSLFCWHKEDLDLDAINYLHVGKQKFWYCIQSQDSCILEKEAKKKFFKGFDNCREYLRHKTCMINPYLIKKSNPSLRITKAEQNPNQFIVAFSGAYHCGFNFGINVAEAVNFATFDWLNKINTVKYCRCRKSSVKIEALPVIQKLLKFPEYEGNQIIMKIREQLKEQNKETFDVSTGQKQQQLFIQQQRELEQSRTYRKQKKIQKEAKGEKRNIREQLRKKREKFIKEKPSELMTQIQCDLCSKWHDLRAENMMMVAQPAFCCEKLGEQCEKQTKSKPQLEESEDMIS